jgi:tetratricopeptide (TPR) repeat protein
MRSDVLLSFVREQVCFRQIILNGMVAGLVFSCLLHLRADEYSAPPSRLNHSELGNEAYKAGNYEQAIAFFSKAKAEAEDHSDLQNAYEQLIAAYLKALQISEARRELTEYEQKMPSAGIGRKTIYKADLLLLERKYADAEKILERMMSDGAISGQLYFHLLSNLGYAQRMQDKWDAAAETYRMLRQVGSDGEWEFPAFVNHVLCLIELEKFKDAEKLLEEGNRYRGEKDYYQVGILRLYRLTKEKKFDEARQYYQTLRETLSSGNDSLLYNIQMTVAQYFMKQKQPDRAVAFLQDARRSAPSASDRRVAMRNLINAYYEIEDGRSAAETAREYLEFYPNAPDATEVRMKVSGLYAGLKEYEEARKILEEVITDEKLPMSHRLAAAKQAAAICESQRDFITAAALLEFVRKNGETVDQREEGSHLLGMIYLKSLNYQEALSVFSRSARVKSVWQGPCMLGMIKAQVELKNYEAALETADRLIREIKSGDAVEKAMYYRGHILKMMERKKEAALAFRQLAEQYPSGEFAANALYEAGNLFYDLREYQEAVGAFDLLLKTDSGYKNLPSALYRSVYANFFAGRIDEAIRQVGVLKEKYPQNEAASAALFWQVDYLRNSEQLGEAAKLLEEMGTLYKEDRDLLARIVIDRAIVAGKQGKYADALTLLDDFATRFVNDRRMGEVLFLGGDLASSNGEYERAAQLYARCEQLRPDSELARAARGRVADCRFSLFGKTGDTKHLQSAREAYAGLLTDEKLGHDAYNQTLYKLAVCEDRMYQEDQALLHFNEVIFRYQLALKRGLKPDPVWAVKAGYAATRMLIRRNTPEDAAAALKIFEQLRELKLETIPEEFSNTILNLKAKYKL